MIGDDWRALCPGNIALFLSSQLRLSVLWDEVILRAMPKLPKMRLDAFLFGPATDPALESVPSMKLVAKQHEQDRFHLPIVDDFDDLMGLPPAKKQKTTKDIAWPTLHKEVLQRCEAPWPRINCQLHQFFLYTSKY